MNYKREMSLLLIASLAPILNPDNVIAGSYVPTETRDESNWQEDSALYIGKHKIVIGVNNVVVALNNGIVNIPEGITMITGYAFSGCDELIMLVIPDSVAYIGAGAFRDCAKLTHIMWRGRKYTDKNTLNKDMMNDGLISANVWL